MCYIGCHNHTAKSNIRLIDSINKTKDLIKTAVDLGYQGLAITDHEVLSSHIEALKITKGMKKEGTMPSDFKLILGNEIYLVDSLEEVRDNYKSGVTKFPHFILLAKDLIGHRQLRELSSMAWTQSFFTGMMERVPTTKQQLYDVISKEPNHLIATTACLGSELAIHTLQLLEARENKDKVKFDFHKNKIQEFMNWCISLFGKENFFVELQPALSNEQITYNKEIIKYADYYGLKTIVATDSHFLRPEDIKIHKAFLNSKDGDRETESFYEACFVQTVDEIKERLGVEGNISEERINEAIANTLLIGGMIEDYDLERPISIPRTDLPDFEVQHLFKKYYDKYEYISKLANSEEEQNRFLIKLIEDGYLKKESHNTFSDEEYHKRLARINIELEELWHISESLKEAMAAYYVTIREIINVMWDDCGGDSLVGPGRGSAAGFYINYLIDITHVNPLNFDLPHWRHLHKSRPDYPDIDLDSQGSKRRQIINALKKRFGERRVINICTFGTEGSKSAILTACRGLGIDNDIGMHIASLIPFERGSNWSISDCLFGNEEDHREPVKEFITEIEKHENLKEVALKIEGLENKRSIHAGGIFIFNDDITERNAIMKAPNGQYVTQFSMNDSEYMGGIKYDMLTIEALDKIREEMNLLLENNEIEWKGSLKNTYDAYIHPDVLDYNSEDIWRFMGNGEVQDLFQFNTPIGVETVKKVKPTSVPEAAVVNSLMRLMSEGGTIQPVDQYVRFKKDISLWYKEMEDYGLTTLEIKIMEKHLLSKYGVADSQESVMIMVMDEEISSFSIAEANILRKAIAKKKKKELEKAHKMFYEKGKEKGTSINLLNYVWEVQIKRQIGYSFSDLHTVVYTIIALQELNLYKKYNSIYWNTACLTVNSASINEDSDEDDNTKSQSTNYGKVAFAIGTMQQHGVKIGLPDINKAGFGFKPDVQENQIIFGLKGINGIGDEVVQHLIQNRPYNTFEDFLSRMYDTSIIKKSQLVQLIKAGCFESFGDRMAIMKIFVDKLYTPKQKLNLQNMNAVIENKLIPEDKMFYSKLFNFRKYVMKRIHKKDGKDKLYGLDKVSTPFYYEHFSGEGIEDYHNNFPVIRESTFKKEYDKKMEGIKKWLSTPEAIDLFNKKQYQNEWDSIAEGSISKWEMDSLSFYYTQHELANMDFTKYGVIQFNDLPEEPLVVEMMRFRNGGSRPKFKLDFITGTVLDKDKNKHTVTLLTTDGVVTVKYYDGAFAHYNKQVSKPKPDGSKEILERSWFTRGNKLVLYGYRRGSQFRPYRYKDSRVGHTTMLITQINEDGAVKIETERKKV